MTLQKFKESPLFLSEKEKHGFSDFDADIIWSVAMMQNEHIEGANDINGVRKAQIGARKILADKMNMSKTAKNALTSKVTTSDVFYAAEKGGLNDRETSIMFLFSVMLPHAHIEATSF